MAERPATLDYIPFNGHSRLTTVAHETHSASRVRGKIEDWQGRILMGLKVARSCAEIDRLRAAWDGLFKPPLSLFQSFRWNRLAAQIFADREEPYFVFAESDSGAAIVPAVIDVASRSIRLAGERLFDYRDYLARGDAEPLRAAWQHVSELNLPLAVCAIYRPDAPVWNCMPKAFYSRAPRLPADRISSDEFAQGHARAFSRLRRLERMGFRITQYRGESPIVRRIYELRARQAATAELFEDRLRGEFMVAICRDEGPGCEVFALEHGGTVGAALITFRDGGMRRFYTTYYDRRWARCSPGVSLLFEIARRSLEQGLGCDLMTGEQAYKVRLADIAQDLFEIKVSASQFRQAIREAGALERAA
jgi:CelD/BcsL family acetyltransferase involved in cellulose biosynthesis